VASEQLTAQLGSLPAEFDDLEPVTGPSGRARAAWRRFTRLRLALPSVVVLALVLAFVLIGPLVYPVNPNTVDPLLFQQGPSATHLLGTDDAGRDVLARLMYGGRVSLFIGFTAALSSNVIGLLLGAIAGYFGRWTNGFLTRFAEVLQAFPILIVIISVAALTGPSITLLIVLVALLDWPAAFRVVRSVTMTLREQEMIQAVEGLGAGNLRILFRHVLPAMLGPFIVLVTIGTGNVIMLEAGLSFLGLGVPPPTASWGSMLSAAESLSVLSRMPWLWLPPGIAILITVLSVNFIGDGLRNVVDPRQAR
jgi:ABC-type dipeptide/oligopeptide/nickel transport system permease subunit